VLAVRVLGDATERRVFAVVSLAGRDILPLNIEGEAVIVVR
jgi:hypothetical protein